MRSFVTGSHAYGTPRPDSDIDLVVLVSPEDMSRLVKMDPDSNADRYGVMCSSYLRYGNLNLLAVDNEIDFAVWLVGTQELIARKPVTRDEAVEVFKRLQKQARPQKEIEYDPFPDTFDWP